MGTPMTALPTGPASAGWVPIEACTLPTAEQPLRVAEFDALFAAALRDVQRPPGTGNRARLLLTGDDGLRDRMQRLADAETACCSFFTFTLTELPGDENGTTVALDVEVPTVHADVLAGLVTRAERARRAAT